MIRCPGYLRHWFAVRGAVGVRSPVCVRCGAPNPTITVEQRREYDDYLKTRVAL